MSVDLGGVRVLDLTRLLPGPYATQHLADLGADVVKVEAPGTGDGAREMAPTTDDGVGHLFDAVNRGKRSVVLDLKSESGRAAFLALAESADAVVEGFRPGVAERLGVDYGTVREVNSDVVYCSLTGFGQDGPYRDRPGHDLNYLAVAGVLDVNRRDESEAPRLPSVPVGDMSGGVFAALAVVSALLSRELGEDGGGTYLDVSMTETALSFAQPLAALAAGGEDGEGTERAGPRPGETPLTGAYPWYDVYETADGRYVALAALEAAFWENFCEMVDRPDLRDVHGTDDPAERAALREELAELFAERPREEWVDVCEDGMVAGVYTPAEALDHPQVASRGIVTGGEDGDGSSDRPRVGFPVVADGERPNATERVPGHGEHTEAVLREVGFDPDRL